MQCIRLLSSNLMKSPLKNARSILFRQKVLFSAMPVPTADGADKTYSPKIQSIATDISSLSLLEVSELSTLLKKTLNLPDTAFINPGAGFAQVIFFYETVFLFNLLNKKYSSQLHQVKMRKKLHQRKYKQHLKLN